MKDCFEYVNGLGHESDLTDVTRAAAAATGCKMNISYETVRNELVQNKALGK